MPDYKLNIIGTFNNKKLVKALKEAGVNVNKLKKETDKANQKTSAFRQATAGLRRTLGAVRNNMLLVTFALGGMGAAIGKTVKDFAKFETVKLGFDELGKSVGFSTEALTKLQTATDGTVTSMELMKQANNAMLLGIVQSEEQMAEMFDIAQRLAAAVGKDAKFGIESLTTGIGRQSRLMLDNLGIIVSTEAAYKDYAAQIGKTVSTLTDQERKTAFINAAMDSAREKVGRLGDEQRTTSMAMDEASASMGEFSIAVGSLFAPAAVAASQVTTKWAQDLTIATLNLKDLLGVQNTASQVSAILEDRVAELAKIQDAYSRGKFTDILGKQASHGRVMAVQMKALKQEIIQLQSRYVNLLSETESYERVQSTTNEVIGETSLRFADLMPGLELAALLYSQTKEAQVELIETQMEQILTDILLTEQTESNVKMLRQAEDVYLMLSARLEKLNELKEDNNDALTKEEKLLLRSAKAAIKKGMAYNHLGQAAQAAAFDVLQAAFIEAAADKIASVTTQMKKIFKNVPPPLSLALAAGVAGAVGSLFGQMVSQAKKIKFAATGMDEVVDSPTLIMAGESGPEHVGITPLDTEGADAPSGGNNITLNISAPLVDETVVETILPSIREALRRGESLGIS